MPDHPRPCNTTRVALLGVLLAAAALGGFSAGHSGRAASPMAGTALNPVAPAQVAPAKAMPDFVELVARVKPAVVSITVQAREIAAREDGGGRSGEGRGTGFLIDANGTIVTNAHVVRGAARVGVTLDDGTELQARVVGRDTRTDIAVLRVRADRPLPFLNLDETARVRPGEWVIALGNPFGLGGSVSAGIVSAAGRNIGAGPYDQFIQIDAPINPGNSGGPLFTQDGRLVGVNTAIISPSGGSVGVGFAVPASLVRNVATQLERDGEVTRGYIGVSLRPAHEARAAAESDAGAMLQAVHANSPAERAGLRAGDLVRAVDGKAITNPRDLAVAIAEKSPGSIARLNIIRAGSNQDIDLKIGRMPDDKMG